MHELSLANDIIETINQNVPKEELNRVKSITLKVGALSGVVSDSLKFSFEAITSDTELEGAELVIIDIPFRLKCNSCGIETANEFPMMLCLNCGSGNTEILSGDELQVSEINVLTEEETV